MFDGWWRADCISRDDKTARPWEKRKVRKAEEDDKLREKAAGEKR